MPPRTLLDTDIFSELMRGKNEVVRARAAAYLKQHGRLTISLDDHRPRDREGVPEGAA